MHKNLLIFFLLAPLCVSAQIGISINAVTDSILESNYAIRISKVEEAITENNNNLGRAGASPRVSLTANQANSYYNTRQEFFSGDVRQAQSAANNSIGGALRVDWAAFSGFRVFATKDNLEIQTRIAELNTLISIEEQLFNAASVFYEIIQKNKTIAAYQMAVQLSRDRIKLAEDRLRIGRGSQLDVLQSQLDLNADSSVLMRETIYRNNLVVQLNTLMGLEGDKQLMPEGTLDFAEMPELQTLIELAQNQNKQVLQAKAGKLLAYTTVRQAKSNLYPGVGVYGEYYFLKSQSQIGLLKSNQAVGPGFGVSFYYSLFNGLNVQNDIENARMQVEIQNLNEQKARQEIKSAVIQSYNNYLLNKQLWMFEKENVLTAAKNLEISKKQLDLGVITDFIFRESQLRYTEAVSREINAQFLAKISELELHLLSAGIIQKLKA